MSGVINLRGPEKRPGGARERTLFVPGFLVKARERANKVLGPLCPASSTCWVEGKFEKNMCFPKSIIKIIF